jgi:hypothetical protein
MTAVAASVISANATALPRRDRVVGGADDDAFMALE